MIPARFKGIAYEYFTPKVAGVAARNCCPDNGAGHLCPAAIYRGAELSLGPLFCPLEGI